MLEPKNESDDAIIMEFKVHDPDDEKTLDDTVQSALRQIEEKRYSVLLGQKEWYMGGFGNMGLRFRGRNVRSF